MNKNIQLLGALKTIQENQLEKKYVAQQISLLEESPPITRSEDVKKIETGIKEFITIYTDGSSQPNPGPSGCACIIKIGDKFIRRSLFLGHQTNNEAEYLGVTLAVSTLKELNLSNTNVYFLSDSQLVMKQLEGEWKIKKLELKNYADEIHQTLKELNINATFRHIPRDKNKAADELADKAAKGEIVDNLEEFKESYEGLIDNEV